MASQTFKALYDGQVLRPEEPLLLQPNTVVELTIQTDEALPQSLSFLKQAQSIKLIGPEDWSVCSDDYLYPGTND